MQVLAQNIDVLYTDGGCNYKTKVGAYSFACVTTQVNDIVLDYKKGYFLFGSSQRVEGTTNNRMELQAVIEGLVDCCRKVTSVQYVVTDSQYVQKGITEWCPNWIKNGWHGSAGVVKNKDLWKQLLNQYEISGFPKIIHTRGHVGVYWNEFCDQACTEAMKSGYLGVQHLCLH